MIMSMVGYNFMKGLPPWQASRLARYLRCAPDHFYDIVDQLSAAHLLIESGDNVMDLLPRRDIASLTVNAILDAVRRGDPAAAPRPSDDRPYRQVMYWIGRSEQARNEALGGLSLRELVTAIIKDRGEDEPPAERD